MKEKALVFLMNFLSKNLKNKIKNRVFAFKSRFPRLILFFNGSFSTEDLFIEIENNIGRDSFDILMVHSSINALLPMYKGNVKELLDYLILYSKQKKVTLVMPTFTLGKKNSGPESFYLNKKVFDVDKTPTTVGLLNELFRRKKDVLRSIHPTHSIAALGPKAEELTNKHHICETSFGDNSPFGIMDSYNTKILGLGVYYYRNLTHVHVVEDILKDKFPYPIKRTFNIIPVKLKNNDEFFKYDLKCYTDSLSSVRDLTILKKHIEDKNLKQWSFKGVPMFLTNAKVVTETLILMAKQGKSIYNK